MDVPLWIVDAAESFWRKVGEPEPFPRELRRSIARGLPVGIVMLPLLSVKLLGEWLERQGIMCSLDAQDRRLHACLVARSGQGLILIDGSDSDEQQRFSIAHELAHFLLHYWRLRHNAVERIGPGALDVLDGFRNASTDERVHAVLSGVEMSLHVHLMTRGINGAPTSLTAICAERDADRLAYELLAPSALVTEKVQEMPERDRSTATVSTLIDAFGFPFNEAVEYAKVFLSPPQPTDSLVSRLGLRP